jgi:signal transduction histidine kinase
MKILGKWNTIRIRLTLLYGSAFFLAGLVFIGLVYFQLSKVLGGQLMYRSVMVQPQAETTNEVQPVAILQLQGEPGNIKVPPALGSRFPDVQDVLRQMAVRMQETRADALNSILVISVAALLVLVVVAGGLGWVLAGRALQPLRQITATARGIADRNLHQRIGMQGPQDEIKDLADTLDSMLERLDRAFDSQQRFIANASHELRTPLAINRTLIEVALLKESSQDTAFVHLGANLLAINQRHERLIDALLMLASSEQEIADPQIVEMADVARHVLQECTVKAQAAGVTVRAALESAPCTGDAVLLERLFQNLIDNAIRYNLSEGGWISVTTGCDEHGRAKVTIENSGSLIPSYEVPRLFEPFRRLTSTERQAEVAGSIGRRGAGLGLSIVRSIVTSHSGEVHAVARSAGGLSISVWLPGGKPNA